MDTIRGVHFRCNHEVANANADVNIVFSEFYGGPRESSSVSTEGNN
ncbi:hypothetical protein [Alteromonas gracilis]